MNYPYANGIISAIDERLFGRSQYHKLSKIDKVDFVKGLIDFGYGREGTTLEERIASELTELRKFLNNISPNRRLTDLFFLEIDAVNIKSAYKKKVFNARIDVFASDGNIGAEALHQAIFFDDYTMLDKNTKDLLKDISEVLQGVDNPRRLSMIVDRIIYDYIFKSLPLGFDSALKVYYQTTVDIKNIVTMVRIKALNWEFAYFEEMFLAGGLIPLSLFKTVIGSDESRLLKEYYEEKLVKGLMIFKNNNNIDEFERYLEQLIINIMKKYRYDSFGIGPIIYYYLAKQAEANNIRLLYSGEENAVGDLTEY